MIQKGSICIWQNLEFSLAYLNGTETTVTKGLSFMNVRSLATKEVMHILCYLTDTEVEGAEGGVAARPHCLRLKNPPKPEEVLERERMLVSRRD